MAIRRDSKGRFAGGGGGGGGRFQSISGVGRATSTGSRARRSAATAKQEISGNKSRAQGDARYARTTTVGSVGRMKTRSSNQAKQRARSIERERRSLLRRGSMRGGGDFGSRSI